MTYPTQIPSLLINGDPASYFSPAYPLSPSQTLYIYKNETPFEYRIALPSLPRTAEDFWLLAEKVIAEAKEIKGQDEAVQEFFTLLFADMSTHLTIHEDFIKRLRAAEKQFFAKTQAEHKFYQHAVEELDWQRSKAAAAAARDNLLNSMSQKINDAAEEQGAIVSSAIKNYNQQKVRLNHLIQSYQLFEKAVRMEQYPRNNFVVNLLIDAAIAGHEKAIEKIQSVLKEVRLKNGMTIWLPRRFQTRDELLQLAFDLAETHKGNYYRVKSAKEALAISEHITEQLEKKQIQAEIEPILYPAIFEFYV